MAQEKLEGVTGNKGKFLMISNPKSCGVPLLRVLALFATAAATLVMALNKDTQTFVVATIGNTPVKVTLNAKFQHTPANILFVIANGIASLNGLLILALSSLNSKYEFTGLRFVIVGVLDMLNIALVSGAATATAFMGELARHGNSHARWNKVCDKFNTFCEHSAGATLASYIGLLFLMIINVISIVKLAKLNSVKNSVIP